MLSRTQFIEGLAQFGLLALILFFLLTGCSSAPSSDAFATSVVASVIAEQTATVLPPTSDAFATSVIASVIAEQTAAVSPPTQTAAALPPTMTEAALPTLECESEAISEGLAPIREFNAPGLVNFASMIRSPHSISLNPSGTCLAASDQFGASIINLVYRQDFVRYLEYESEPLIVRWSPDGTLIAGSQKSRVVHLWDPKSGERKGVIRVEDAAEVVSFLAWSPDSRYLLTLGNGQEAYIWDVAAKQVRSVIEAGAVHFVSAAWSPDGRTLALGTDEGGLFFAELTNGVLIKLSEGLTESQNTMTSVAWSAEGTQLAYTEGTDIRIFDVEAGFPTQRLPGNQKQALAIAWSPDGTMIAAGYAQADFIVWQAAQAKPLFEENEFAGDVTGLEWTPDGAIILTAGGGGIKYWGVPQ